MGMKSGRRDGCQKFGENKTKQICVRGNDRRKISCQSSIQNIHIKKILQFKAHFKILFKQESRVFSFQEK